MRYNVHPPRAFRNRIAKSIGVLVAAALIATLGLPSAAQAQTSARRGAVGDRHSDDGTGFTVTWHDAPAMSAARDMVSSVNNWIVTSPSQTAQNGGTSDERAVRSAR